MWYENFKFVADPYSTSDPYSYPSSEFFEWNRGDLNRTQLDLFMSRVLEGKRTGIKVYGPSGSGKTWLARIIEKELKLKEKKGLVIYTRLTSLDPSFSAIYDNFLDDIMGDMLAGVFESFRSSGKHTLLEWKTDIHDDNLAACLWHYAYEEDKKDYCQMWLRGERLSASYLDEIKATYSLDRDTKKFKIMKSLIGILISVYPLVTLIVDELENVRPVYAKAVSDVLRELIDSFYHKFALICFYTAERADDWYDLGYTDFLYRRLELLFSLDSVEINYGPDWLRKLHKTYREEKFSGDQLVPFTEEGIKKLLELMEPTKRYPGCILPNCTTLAEQAIKEKTLIDENLFNKCASAGLLTDLSAQTTFI